MAKLCELKVEKLINPTGIDVRFPRFSWKILAEEKNVYQSSYRVTVATAYGDKVWDSGEVNSSSTLVNYNGEGLFIGCDYLFDVSVILNNGEKLSSKTSFSTGQNGEGLLTEARWIAYPIKGEEDYKICPAFRKEFKVKSKVLCAKAYTSGLGVYESFINGERISSLSPNGEQETIELKPGYTQILERKLYNSFDITHLVKEGMNCISAISSHGWWADDIADNIGRYPCFLAAVCIYYENGKGEYFVTDSSWKVSENSPLISASIYGGEKYDARVSLDFMKSGFDDKEWKNAFISHQYLGKLTSLEGANAIERKDLIRKPIKAYTYSKTENQTEEAFGVISDVKLIEKFPFTLKKGQTLVVDFGQNASGRERFEVEGKTGTVITIRHAEMLNDNNGLKARGNDGAEGTLYLANLRSAKATTEYILSGKGREKYAPLFTYYGFRYIDVTATEDVTLYSIVGEVITSVREDSGFIKTGSELVNRLIENGRWGMYSNYLSIPTDCPQRDERYGWSADTQIFSATAGYLSASAVPFLEKWMVDVRDASDPGGAFPAIAPRARFGNTMGDLGWADAGIIVPYNVWKASGDNTIVRDNYPAMKKYMDFFLKRRKFSGPLPRYGDWLSFEDNDDALQEYLGVCFYAYDAFLMTEMAREMGIEEDEGLYFSVYEKQKEYFAERYLNEVGELKLTQQTALLYALKLKLLPNENSLEKVKAQLKNNFSRDGGRLQTGFLGTAILLPTLSEVGLNDLAYSLLLSEEMPSWLFSVKSGATTIWERWNSYSVDDGFGEVGMNSFNHYAYGCVAEWLFSYSAGIRTESAGFERFILAPLPDKRLGYCEAEYNSEQGLIKSAWQYDGNRVKYKFQIPPNTTAIFINPKTGERKELSNGIYKFTI